MGINIFNLLGDNSNEYSLIPFRDPGSTTGSQFIQNNISSPIKQREQNILDEFLHGNIPDFLRKFIPVVVSEAEHTITYLVMPDVLSIGNDNDYVRMPMNPLTAQKIADKYDCTLPTKKMAYDIWKAATNKLEPLPWGPPYDASMLSTERIGIHNSRIQEQLKDKDYTALTTGHKKDVILTNILYPGNLKKRVAIYGWIDPKGHAIQGLNPASHEDTYADYSHGIRMIARDVIVDGQVKRIDDVFSDSEIAYLVSDESILKFTRY